ncbi:hypothetical protein [Cytobacillus gottheilii]|uniref:hypothetical protein n=1 Tax=Cytobacillus gottheilii TaxID=859144 RepID=UPI002494CD99|nr:hypothetical protein [Cytobacillus gottheilii]
MDKLFVLLMVVLFAVGLTSQSIFDEDGMQADALEMKDNTQEIIGDANSQMENFGGSGSN